MRPSDKARLAEHNKYYRAYALNPNYKMGKPRMAAAMDDLEALPNRGAYVDIACGRGEMVKFASSIGFSPVMGTEIVQDLLKDPNIVYGEVHALPFDEKQFSVATMFDVIEHLIPGDDMAACHELKRITRRHVLLTANNKPSFNKAKDDLHINKRPYEEWDRLFQAWFFPGRVTWLRDRDPRVSECWRVDFP